MGACLVSNDYWYIGRSIIIYVAADLDQGERSLQF